MSFEYSSPKLNLQRDKFYKIMLGPQTKMFVIVFEVLPNAAIYFYSHLLFVAMHKQIFEDSVRRQAETKLYICIEIEIRIWTA